MMRPAGSADGAREAAADAPADAAKANGARRQGA